MELKQDIREQLKKEVCNLLIVPYGIETKVNKKLSLLGVYLLIVPYGIETKARLISCQADYGF